MGVRPAMLFHDPYILLTSRSVAKSSLACTGMFGSSATGECAPLSFPATDKRDSRVEGEDLVQIYDPHFGHMQHIWLHGREALALLNQDEQKGRNDR